MLEEIKININIEDSKEYRNFSEFVRRLKNNHKKKVKAIKNKRAVRGYKTPKISRTKAKRMIGSK